MESPPAKPKGERRWIKKLCCIRVKTRRRAKSSATTGFEMEKKYIYEEDDHDGENWQKLPVELIDKILDYAEPTIRELKSLRLLSRSFADIVAPRLFRRVRMAFSVPERYSYCKKHGWYLDLQTDNERQPCNGRKLHSRQCPFYNSPPSENFKDPIVEPLRQAIRGFDVISAAAKDLTITVPTAINVKDPKWLDIGESMRGFAEIIPLALDAMPGIRTVRIIVQPRQETQYYLANFLRAVCEACRSHNVELHVMLVRVHWWTGCLDNTQLAADYLGALSSLSSLDINILVIPSGPGRTDTKDDSTGCRQALLEKVAEVVARSPNLRLPDLEMTTKQRKDMSDVGGDDSIRFKIQKYRF